MSETRRRAFWMLIPLLAVLVGYGRLVVRYDALLADAARPSLDHAGPPGTRGIGNDLTSFWLPKFVGDTNARDVTTRPGPAGWDASGFAGRPATGNPQSSRSYPPYWVALGLRHPASLGWLTVFHLVLGGLGTALFLKALGVDDVAATLAGGLYGITPYLTAQTVEGHYPHVWAVCWYPWAFLGYRWWAEGRVSGWVGLPIVLALAFLTGHPQEWYLLVLALSVWTAVVTARMARDGRRKGATLRIAGWALLVLVSIGLCAVELLPQLAAQPWTLHPQGPESRSVSRYYVHSINLFQLLSPLALGGPSDYFGHDNYWETVLSIGVVPLLLAVLGVSRHPERGVVRGMLGLVGVAVLLAGGQRLGLFALATKVVPGMSRFRVPARSLFLANFGAIVLAGLGLDVLRRGSLATSEWRVVASRMRRASVVLLVFLALALAVGLCWGSAPRGTFERSQTVAQVSRAEPDNLWAVRGQEALDRIGRDGVVWMALGAVLAVSGFAPRNRITAPRVGLLLGLVGLAELTAQTWRVVVVAPISAFRETRSTAEAIAPTLASTSGPLRVAASPRGLTDLDAVELGVEKTNINDSFQIQHAAFQYERLYPFLEEARRRLRVEQPMDDAVLDHRRWLARSVLARMSVGWVVRRNEPGPAQDLGLDRVDLFGLRGFAARWNDPMPRCYVVPRAYAPPERAEPPATVLARLDPREGVILDTDSLDAERRQPFQPAKWEAARSDEVHISVATRGAGYLVVTDTWMPGWTALVDGTPEHVLRGDSWLQVVPLRRAGAHNIVLRYAPPAREAGRLGSLVAALVWAGIVLVRLRTARTAVSTPAHAACG